MSVFRRGRRTRLPLPRGYELAANWKIGCENYLECYHCRVAHKGFSAAYDVDPDEYRLEPTGEHVLSQFANTREGGGQGQAQFHFVWPNLRVNVVRGNAEPLDRAAAARRPGTLDGASSTTSSPRTRTGDW